MTDWIKLEETQKAQHLKTLNEDLARIGFKPGELQAAVRNGGNLAPFTMRELELGLLDAFANMGGGTVWCGDGSSCAVQILLAERARAHAEGLEAGRREMAEEAAGLLDAEVADHRAPLTMDEALVYVCDGKRQCEDYGCTTLERFAADIRAAGARSLIPAAPEVKDE